MCLHVKNAYALYPFADMPPANHIQMLMFSATLGPQVVELAKEFLEEEIFLAIGKVGGTTESITQVFAVICRVQFPKWLDLGSQIGHVQAVIVLLTQGSMPAILANI